MAGAWGPTRARNPSPRSLSSPLIAGSPAPGPLTSLLPLVPSSLPAPSPSGLRRAALGPTGGVKEAGERGRNFTLLTCDCARQGAGIGKGRRGEKCSARQRPRPILSSAAHEGWESPSRSAAETAAPRCGGTSARLLLLRTESSARPDPRPGQLRPRLGLRLHPRRAEPARSGSAGSRALCLLLAAPGGSKLRDWTEHRGPDSQPRRRLRHTPASGRASGRPQRPILLTAGAESAFAPRCGAF